MTPAETELEIERLHAAGFAWAMACCGRRRERAEDVLQASYLKILDGRARFEGRSSFKTFLFGVIRRTASEERRRALLTHFLFRNGTGPEEITGSSSDPISVEHLAFRRALEKLPGRQREVLELVFSMGMTVQEAAETLSITAGSARVHYDRGKKRLGALLGRGSRA